VLHAALPSFAARECVQFFKPCADIDLRVHRAPGVFSDSFLLRMSSIGDAETLLEAAVHHPRAYSAA